MNPVDHPHGGGEGKTSGGRSPVSPWGQSAKGLKTRRPKRSDKFIITRRKKGSNMTRSIWKGPFVHPSLLKKLINLRIILQKNLLKLGQGILQLFLIL